MNATNAPQNAGSLQAEQKAHEPSMEDILNSIRKIIADDDALPLSRRATPKAAPEAAKPVVAEVAKPVAPEASAKADPAPQPQKSIFVPPLPPRSDSLLKPPPIPRLSDLAARLGEFGAPLKPVAAAPTLAPLELRPSLAEAPAPAPAPVEPEAQAPLVPAATVEAPQVDAPQVQAPQATTADAPVASVTFEPTSPKAPPLAFRAQLPPIAPPKAVAPESATPSPAPSFDHIPVSPEPVASLVDAIAPALAASMASAPRPTILPPARLDRAEPALLSDNSGVKIGAAFEALAESALLRDPEMVERLTREILRPIIKSWLDDNLPNVVERLVRAEIERVARGTKG